MTTPARTFADLGASQAVVGALAERGIVDAFPIQEAVIEATLGGRDICGKAPTGSGKTLAFGVPAIDLAEPGGPWHPSVLILSPTRELATQIKTELEPLAKARGRRILTVFGGTNIERDIKQLERGVDILVACPGRLEDLIARRCCELRDARLVVVDEADRMADMGFLPAVKRILDLTPADRHTLLFSATLDGDVDALITRYQDDPLTFEVESTEDLDVEVEHSWYLIEPHNRIDAAVAVLQRYWSSIVFCRTRRGCDRVAKLLAKRGLDAVAIHGDRSQAQRERALRDFTSGKAQVLVATDVAARGIHVDDVALVMHYDPANSDKDYIHRSGRTGRAGQPGRVISMVVEDKRKIAEQLQKDLGVPRGFERLDLEELPTTVERPVPRPEPEPTPPPRSTSRRGEGKGKGGGRRQGQGSGQGGGRRQGQGRSEGQKREDQSHRGSGRDRRQSPNRRRKSNDWYPPGWDDERDGRDGRGSRGSTGKKSAPAGKRGGQEDRPSGGRNTAQRKSRSTKGRHADRNANKNKGRRRGPNKR